MIINAGDVCAVDYIAKEVRDRRPDLPLLSVHIERSYPQPGTAWEDGTGSEWSPWVVTIVTIDKVVNECQMVTHRHSGKGFAIAEAAERALNKLSQYEIKRKEEHLPLRPWFSNLNKDQEDFESENDTHYEWVRDEVQKRVTRTRDEDEFQ